jgi:hypothetical protein
MHDEPEFCTLEYASSLFGGKVTVRQLRAQIARGKLEASKPGKFLLVRLSGVRALYAPVVRAQVEGIRRGEGPTAREDAQLARAGIVVPPGGIGRGA